MKNIIIYINECRVADITETLLLNHIHNNHITQMMAGKQWVKG